MDISPQDKLRIHISGMVNTYYQYPYVNRLMHELARPEWSGTRGGLIHVPWLPEQGQPSMRADEIVEGLRVAIDVALHTHRDIRKQAGALN